MLLSDCQTEIEAGRTAKLSTPVTGFDLIIRVQKLRDQFIWQRAKIEDPPMDAITKRYLNWQALIIEQSGMQTRDKNWELCDDQIEIGWNQ